MRYKFLLCTLLALLVMFPGCASGEYADIAATTLPVYQFTQQLCEGTGLSVTRLVNENISCLHDYSLNVSQVKSLEAAKIAVISGGGLEESMEELLEKAKSVIDCSSGIEFAECHDHEHEQEHGHHHEQDAHIWLSPKNAMQMVHNIHQGLLNAYPEHEGVFNKNLKQLIGELEALEEYGRQQLETLSCREMITFHDGFGYFAQAFDLEILQAIEEESGSEASAQELISLIATVQEHQLPALFTERNGSVSAADIIAAETGATIYALDMAIAGEDYFQAMYHNIDTVKEALG